MGISIADAAYVAGLFDGEGSVYFKRMKQKKHQRPGKPVHNVTVIRMEIAMTDITKYRNVSLTHETYKTLISLSKVLLPDAKLSISKTIEALTNEKAKKLNGKIKKI